MDNQSRNADSWVSGAQYSDPKSVWLQLIIATDKTSIHRETNNNVPHILVVCAPLIMSNSQKESINKIQIEGISIC